MANKKARCSKTLHLMTCLCMNEYIEWKMLPIWDFCCCKRYVTVHHCQTFSWEPDKYISQLVISIWNYHVLKKKQSNEINIQNWKITSFNYVKVNLILPSELFIVPLGGDSIQMSLTLINLSLQHLSPELRCEGIWQWPIHWKEQPTINIDIQFHISDRIYNSSIYYIKPKS